MRAVVVGLGKMGRIHTRALISNGIDVVAGFDVSIEKAESYREEFAIPGYAMARLPDILATLTPEFASIATTTPAKYDVQVDLLNSKSLRWILAEKPFSSSLSQTWDLLRKSSLGKKILAINHQMMFLPPYLRVREIIAEKKMGDLVSMSVSGSNFGLANKVTHYFEAFRFLTGQRITRVSAELDDETLLSHRGPEFLDFSGRLSASNSVGQSLDVEFSNRNMVGIFVTYNFEFGKVFVDEIDGRFFVAYPDPGAILTSDISYTAQQPLVEHRLEPISIELATARLVRAVIDGEPFPGVEAIENSMESLVGAIMSSRDNGRPFFLARREFSDTADEIFSWS